MGKCQVCEIADSEVNIDSSFDDEKGSDKISSVCKSCAKELGYSEN